MACGDGPGWTARGRQVPCAKQSLRNRLIEFRHYIELHGTDLKEVLG